MGYRTDHRASKGSRDPWYVHAHREASMTGHERRNTLALLATVVGIVMGASVLCAAESQTRQRVDVAKTLDVRQGRVDLNLEVGDITFIYADVRIDPPSKGAVRIRLKVSGSNFSNHDHDVEVEAKLVGESDVVLSTVKKSREIEEDEKDKSVSLDFYVSPERLAAGLHFNLTLSYIP
jgi:hypothetical protein